MEKKGILQKLKDGLSRTRGTLFSGVFGTDRINAAFYDELEEALIVADVGMELSEELIEALRERVSEDKLSARDDARSALTELLCSRMEAEPFMDSGETVLLIVGVNGVGKTTTVGKLAHLYKEAGRAPMIAAADTFRAAAAEQLSVWAERADVPMIKHGDGADPAAVVFDAAQSFKARGRDVLVCDTAGRLHNKKNLMEELKKIRRVIDRELPDAHVEALLVLDATTGQNAIQQAKAFSEATGLTGVIITKLDGTAKGGVAAAVKSELGLPVRFVGVGEQMDDLLPFDPKAYAQALLKS